MIDYFFLLNLQDINKSNVDSLFSDIKTKFVNKSLKASDGYYFSKAMKIYETNNDGFLILGDLIIPSNFKSLEKYIQFEFKNFSKDTLKKLKGHFYIFRFNKILNEIWIMNSMFSILPIYYYKNKNGIYLSSRIELFKKYVKENFTFNKRYLLENILFNYQLFNQTYLKKVNLLPTNSFIKINMRGFEILKHTRIEEFYVDNPISVKNSTENISDLFIAQSKDYLPKDPYWIALTGGFDGRTLTAISLFYKKQFTSYSFGIPSSKDIKLAKKMSSIADIKYKPIFLDETYIEKHSLNYGLKFIQNSEGNASFSRAHYLYSSELISKNTNYILTGNFGSDVLRGANVRGVLTSPNLCDLFFAENFDQAISRLKNSSQLKYLNLNSFKKEFESLIEDIKNLPIFNQDYYALTKNQKYYILIFEEVFRKYFGMEIINQNTFLYNRTPFLDFSFLKGLLKTQLAGIYTKFFERNPFKRIYGQILYPNIIKKTYPLFNLIKTDNGYSPGDLMSIAGKMNVLKGYLNKKISRFGYPQDPFCVYSAFRNNYKYFSTIKQKDQLFSNALMGGKFSDNVDLDTLFIALSQLYWTQYK